MTQVETMPKAFIEDDPWAKPIWEEGFTTAKSAVTQVAEQLGGELVAESPICKHGHMLLKEGDKNGKPYRGHVCPEKVKANQCPAVWYVLTSEGKWKERI
jgi:hypothetical protein